MFTDFNIAFEAIKQGLGMHRGAVCGAYFGVTGATWHRWVKQFKLDPGILLSARNRSWTGAYLRDLHDKMLKGEWKIQVAEPDIEAMLPKRGRPKAAKNGISNSSNL